jgi:membrane protease YdiL (CAAX protease family)
MAELTTSRAWLLVEFATLFFGVPWAMTRRWLPRQPILVLLIASIACAWYLLSDASFDRSRLWNGAAALAQVRVIALIVLTLAPLLCLVAWLLARDEMFMLLRQRPLLWLLIMIFYPVVSVYPQELIYRAFLFQRYAPLFSSRVALVTASALAFSFAHVLFRPPWVAMSTCLVGGAVFAAHYYTSGSLAVVCWEHAIFGQLIFTVGLGRYFYHGAR